MFQLYKKQGALDWPQANPQTPDLDDWPVRWCSVRKHGAMLFHLWKHEHLSFPQILCYSKVNYL